MRSVSLILNFFVTGLWLFSPAMVVAAFMPMTGNRRTSKTMRTPTSTTTSTQLPWMTFTINTSLKGADSDVSFDNNLDGSKMRIGIIRTRWNQKHVNNLVAGIRQGLTECNVTDTNIFETTVPGAFELPMAARFLALSGTVDAIICCGVLIKGETMHFEYISDAVAKGIMNTGLQTSTPCILGVLTCMNEAQVVSRSSGNNNHGVDWGKTSVEMALLRTEALGGKAKGSKTLADLGFGVGLERAKDEIKKTPGFF